MSALYPDGLSVCDLFGKPAPPDAKLSRVCVCGVGFLHVNGEMTIDDERVIVRVPAKGKLGMTAAGKLTLDGRMWRGKNWKRLYPDQFPQEAK